MFIFMQKRYRLHAFYWEFVFYISWFKYVSYGMFWNIKAISRSHKRYSKVIQFKLENIFKCVPLWSINITCSYHEACLVNRSTGNSQNLVSRDGRRWRICLRHRSRAIRNVLDVKLISRSYRKSRIFQGYKIHAAKISSNVFYYAQCSVYFRVVPNISLFQIIQFHVFHGRTLIHICKIPLNIFNYFHLSVCLVWFKPLTFFLF